MSIEGIGRLSVFATSSRHVVAFKDPTHDIDAPCPEPRLLLPLVATVGMERGAGAGAAALNGLDKLGREGLKVHQQAVELILIVHGMCISD